MAIAKKNELKGLPLEELKKKLSETEAELASAFRERKTQSRQQNPGKHKALRRLRARIKTLLSRKGIKV